MSSDRPTLFEAWAGPEYTSSQWPRRTLGAVVCLISLTLVGWGRIDEQAAMQQANHYVADRDYRAAVIELKKVLQQNAANAEVRLLLGTTYLASDDGGAAER